MSVPSQQFFLSTQDLTGATSVTAAQLNQILTSGYPFTDKGMIIWTTDGGGGVPNTPDAVTYPSFALCIWGRISPSTSTISLYYWNPNTGSVAFFAKWQSIISSIPARTITGTMVALGTLTGDNMVPLSIFDSQIASLSGAKIIAGTIPASAFTSTIPGTSITANSITSGQVSITDATALINTNIQSIAQAGGGLEAVGATGKLKVDGTANQLLQVNAGATALAWVTDLFHTLSVAGIGTAGQTPVVNSGATAIGWASTFSKVVSITDPNNAGLPADDSPTVIPHTLGATPKYVRVVLVNLTGQGGYSAGDEVDISAITYSNGTFRICPIGITSGATSVAVLISSAISGSPFSILTKGGTTLTTITRADWIFKLYAGV